MANLGESPVQLHAESPSTDGGRDYAERELQNFLVENPSALGIPNAKVLASEYQTEVGRIDLLISSGPQELWVVELKSGVATRDAIGQIASYIGAVRDKHPDKEVYGLLVATGFDKSCLAAHKHITEVELKKVRIQYVLTECAPMTRRRGSSSGLALLVTKRSALGVSTVRCWSCGTEREVSSGAQAFACNVCKAFNTI